MENIVQFLETCNTNACVLCMQMERKHGGNSNKIILNSVYARVGKRAHRVHRSPRK